MEEVILLLNNIIERLDKIEEKIDNLEHKQNKIETNTEKMDNHIQFVENVYDKVKQPLLYVSNKVNSYIGLSHVNLPEIEQ
jgi:archaellum component FlaC